MIIQGSHVRLRDRRMDDFADYQRWFAPGQEWQQWDAPWESVTALGENARQRWEQQLFELPPVPRVFLEIETVAGRHIGWVNGYWVDEANRWRECGIAIPESDLWGNGLGREAFFLWMGYQIEAFGLPRIGMGTWSANKRMMRVAARCGMRQEACFRDARLVDGKRYDAVRWGVALSEWQRFQEPRRDGLRRFVPADWDSAVELVRQLFNHHRCLQGASSMNDTEASAVVFGWSRQPDTVLWVWQEAGTVVGLARARYQGVYFLEEVVIAEGCRHQGIGTRFLTALEEDLRGAGERDLFLNMVWPGNRGAIDFYRRRGYDLINSIELRKGLCKDRRGQQIEFLARSFHLLDSVPQTDDSGRTASDG